LLEVEASGLVKRCCAGDGGLLVLRDRLAGEGLKPPCAAAVNEPWW
jgi:hypothetical protein